MRRRIRISRVQAAEGLISAKDEESALRTVEEELTNPYGFLGSWQTVETAAEIVGVESNVLNSPASTPEGPMLERERSRHRSNRATSPRHQGRAAEVH